MSGKLIMIGGGEIQKERNTFNSNLMSQLFIKKPIKKILVVIPPGPEEALEQGIRKYKILFKKIMDSEPQFLILEEKKKIKKVQLKEVSNAELIFFCGGQQEKIMQALSGDFIQLIKDRYNEDNEFSIAGTSAGAMIFSKNMITEGGNEGPQVDEHIKLTLGLNLLPNIILDTHFIKRGRFARLANVVKRNPNCMGIGIEADSAIIFEQENELRTYGYGSITLIDGTHIKTNLEANGCIFNLKVHLLNSGCSINIKDLSC